MREAVVVGKLSGEPVPRELMLPEVALGWLKFSVSGSDKVIVLLVGETSVTKPMAVPWLLLSMRTSPATMPVAWLNTAGDCEVLIVRVTVVPETVMPAKGAWLIG